MDFKVQNKAATVNQLVDSDTPIFSKDVFDLFNLAPYTVELLDGKKTKDTLRNILNKGYLAYRYEVTTENTIHTTLSQFGEGGLKFLDDYYCENKLEKIRTFFSEYGLNGFYEKDDVVKTMFNSKMHNHDILRFNFDKIKVNDRNIERYKLMSNPIGLEGEFENAFTYGSYVNYLYKLEKNIPVNEKDIADDVDGGQILKNVTFSLFNKEVRELKTFDKIRYVPNFIPEEYSESHIYFAKGVDITSRFEKDTIMTKPTRQLLSAIIEIDLVMNLVKQRKIIAKDDDYINNNLKYMPEKIRSRIKLGHTMDKILKQNGYFGFSPTPVTKHDFNPNMSPHEARIKIAQSSLHMEYLLKTFVKKYGSNLK